MAGRKGNGRDFDDFDIDNLDDNLMDLDFGDDDSGRKRTPIQKVKSGVKMGVGSAFDSPDFRRRFLKGSLPKEYSAGIEGAREILSETRNLYNTTSEEVRQTGREVRDFLGRSLPSSKRWVPGGLAKKINDWLGDEEQESRADDYEKNLEESELATALGEIFKVQAEDEAKKEETEQLKRERDKTIDKRRFQTQQTLLGRMVELNQRMVAYQDNVTIAYQRKHLEMEMRQYNVLRRIHNVLVQDSKNQDTIQKGILRNTGLPDFQKIKQSEAFRESIRNRLYGAIAEGPMVGVSSLMRGFAKNLSQNILASFRSSLETVRDAAQTAGAVGEMGVDKTEMGGMVAGNLGTEFLARKVGRQARKLINRNPNAARYGRRFSRVFGDMERFANTFASGDSSDDYYEPEYDDEGNEIKEGFLRRQGRRLRRGIRQNLPSYQPDQTLLVKSRPGSLNEPDLITNRFTRTVEEVIPKLLSMIYGEVRSTRTGKPVSAFHYDFSARKVVNDSEATKGLNDKLFSESRRRDVNDDVDRVMEKIDPEKKLSRSARAALRSRVIREARLGRQFSPKEFSSNKGWGEGANPSDIGEIRELIQDRFGYTEGKGFGQSLEDEERRDSVDSELRRLSTYSPEAKNDVLNIIRAGNLNAARATGLVDETEQGWFFNEEKYYDYLISGQRPDEMDAEGYGGEGRGPGPVRPRGGRRPKVPKGGGGIGAQAFERHTNRIIGALDKGFEGIRGLMERGEERDGPTDAMGRLVNAGEMSNAWLEEISEQIRNIRMYGINLGDIGESVKRGYEGAKERAGLAGAAAKVRARIIGRNAKARWLLGSRWAKRKAEEIQDAYVKGRVGPALRAELIRAREYVDVNTGKVIEKISDVTGEVRDQAGDVVLTAGEYKEGLLDKHGDKLVAAYIGAEDFVRQTLPRAFRAIPDMLREARQQFHNVFDGPEDVYVKGEKKPRLLARVMRDRGYFKKEDGSVLRRPVDIDGEIVDKDGNLMLSEEDIAKGLVDKHGDEFEGFGGKLANTISDVRDRLESGRLRASSLLKTAGATALGAIGNAIGHLDGFSIPGLVIGGQKDVVNAIDRIYNLIAPQFGGEPLDNVAGRAKEGIGRALRAKDWLKGKADMLRGRSFADKRRLVKARRKARAAGQRFGIPRGLGGGGIRAAWEKANAMRERQGKRRGSWLSIMKKRRKAAEDGEETGSRRKKKKGGLLGLIAGGIFSGLGMVGRALFGSLAGGFGAFGSLILGGFRAIPKIAKGMWWVAKKGLPLATRALFKMSGAIVTNVVKGFADLGKLLMFSIGGLGRGLGKLTKSVATGFMKGGIFRRAGSGAANALRKAPGKAKGAGSWLMRAAKTGGKFLLTRALPAIGTALISPIGIGIAAAAALAFGGYKLYQYIKSKNAILVRMRMVQYGIDFEDEQQVNKVDRLEQALIKDVRIAKDGSGRIESRLNPKDLLAIFDISSEDEEAVRPWTIWFVRRFKPVFLRHVAAMKTVMDRYRLSGTQTDLLKIDEKLETWQAKYDFAVRVKDMAKDDQGQYATEYMDSPFPGIELEYDRPDASEEYDDYVDRLKGLRDDEIDDEGKYKVDDRVSGDNKWNSTVTEKENLAKRREQRMKQEEMARAWRTEEEKRAKNRLEAAMAAAKASPNMAGESAPLVDKAKELYQQAVENAAVERQQSNAKGWLWPTTEGRISSMYGRRIDPISGKPAGHGGIDIAAPIGTPIFAAFDGIIRRRAYSTSYGNVIYLEHPDGRCTRYAHMDRFEPGLSVGDRVRTGQILGYMGSTGKSTGSHLHFEIRKNNAAFAPTIDPLSVVTDPKIQKEAQRVVEEAKLENDGKERDFKDDPESPMEGKDTIASTEAGAAITSRRAVGPDGVTESRKTTFKGTSQGEGGEELRKAIEGRYGKTENSSDSPPVSAMGDALAQSTEEQIQRERRQRVASPSGEGPSVQLPNIQRQQYAQKIERARQESQARRQEQLASDKSVVSASKMVELNEAQLALQKEMRDALSQIAKATQSFETITPEILSEFLSPKAGSDYQPRNPGSNELNRRNAPPTRQASPTIPMR